MGTLIGMQKRVSHAAELSPHQPLLITLGDDLGESVYDVLSYLDYNGSEKNLGITISSYDGSVAFVNVSLNIGLE